MESKKNKTFNIEQANRLAEHYKYLIGRNFSLSTGEYKICYVAVVPTDLKQFERWTNEIYLNYNYKKALLISGFDKNCVAIKLFTSVNTVTMYTDLDTYLTEYGEEKIYLADNFNLS